VFGTQICVSGHTGDLDNVTQFVMGIEEDGFKILVDESNKEVGAALLLSHVGEDTSVLSTDIIDSLNELHSKGILHGDARLANVVRVGGNPMWIDFCTTEFAASQSSCDKEMQDFLKLVDQMKSVANNSK
jgi:tRNA A-37 threonylcarbamoyl transferase component Bud32